MQSGSVPRFVLFGGGRMLLHFARSARARGAAVTTFCGAAHADEIVEGSGLREGLEHLGVDVRVVSELSAAEIAPLIDVATIGLSLSAPWIVRRDVIDLFAGRLYNLHGTDLPHNRGGGGFTWQILRGDRRGGLSLHELVEAVDEGGLVQQVTFTYPDACRTPADFARHRQPLEDTFLAEFLDRALAGEVFEPVAQNEAHAVYWPRLSTAVHGWIDWSWSAAEIVRFCDAFGDPYPGGGTLLRDREIRIACCDVHEGDDAHHPFQTGLVYRVHDGAAYVATRDAAVAISAATRDGEDVVPALRPGQRLHTPRDTLDRAQSARAVVTASGLQLRD